MAEQAQQEPTMEEILSSIRKIIADDDSSPQAAVSAEVVDVQDTGVEDFDDLDMAVEDFVEDLPQTEDDVLAAISNSSDSDVFDPISDFDDLVEEPKMEDIEDRFELSEDLAESISITQPEPYIAESFAAEPELAPDPIEDIPMAMPDTIIDAKIADAAAGSLGRLLSKVQFGEDAGGNNTIDGLVRELLRPMLKEWLDANLPGIVENAVEQEVARIARKAS